MKILNYFGANDAISCIVGHISCFGYSLWIALAKYRYQGALTVSMISKWLEVNERNNIFTLITEINTIILAFGGSLFNWIYAKTVTYQKNFTLLFASGLCIIPVIPNLCLFMITRQISNVHELTQINAESSTISLTNNLPPQPITTDVTCLILLSRSRTNSLCTSYNERSRANSHSSIDDQNDRQIII